MTEAPENLLFPTFLLSEISSSFPLPHAAFGIQWTCPLIKLLPLVSTENSYSIKDG